MANGAEQRSSGRVAGMFVLDSPRCALILEQGSNVCHCDYRGKGSWKGALDAAGAGRWGFSFDLFC